MNDDVVQSLAIATQFANHAQYAGTQRQAIADGYSAIDAAFSALLLAKGIKLSRNHKQKLDAVRKSFPDLLDGYTDQPNNGKGTRVVGGVAWTEVEAFYKEWLQARYDPFSVSPAVARRRVGETLRTLDFTIRAIAKVDGSSPDEVKAKVDTLAFGTTDCVLYEALSEGHSNLFDEAERRGEAIGNKFGAKMAAVTNFAMLDLIASDELTRDLIKNDTELASECVRLHNQLCRMIHKLRTRRYDAFVDRGIDHRDSNNDAPDFMFSLRFKYHGAKYSEVMEDLGKTLGGLFKTEIK